MKSGRRRIELYQTEKGGQPFPEWLNSLKDGEARAKIKVKIERLSLGNVGGCKALGGGVHELKIDFGPGYRVYFGEDGNAILVLLCGGDKSTQGKDIDLAKKYWADYKKRTNEQKTKH